MSRKDGNLSNNNNDLTETIDISLEELNQTNIGMKKPDPSSHSNIAQIPDGEEYDYDENPNEKTEKKSLRLLFEKKRQERERKDQLDNELVSKESVEQNSRSNKVERFEPNINFGLNEAQVNQRIKEGLINDTKKQYSKTYKQIFFKNIFTFFNILCLGVAIALVVVREYKNLSFMLILGCNTVIGIVQEIKAKKIIDKLSIVTTPTAIVVREGLQSEIKIQDLVLDDIIKLKSGKQISADCIVVDGDIEVNESLLTGESIAVKKKSGDTLYAGSYITSGSCYARVNRVGQDCYIQRLQARAKRYSKPKSELLRSLKTVTTFVTIVIVPLGTIVAWKNYTAAQSTVPAAAFGKTGELVVYGVNNDDEYEIGKITDMYNTDDDDPNTFSSIKYTTIESGNGNLIPSVSQIKLAYDNKVSGNISVASIKVTELVKNDTEYGYENGSTYEWDFKAHAEDPLETICSRYNGAKNNSRYSDGTIKLDDTGDYFVTKSFDNNKSFSTLTVEIMVQSRGYGFDETELGVTDAQIAKQTITKTAGSLVGMIPTGLFLLVTIALAVSVVKLAQSETLVQELYCIEMLARVDCICLDKTGTITDGTMVVKDIIDIAPINPKDTPIDIIMGAFLGALEDNNMTSVALKKRFGENFELHAIATLPFSSSRKLSAVTFEGKGTYILGAPEFVYQGKSKKISSIVAKKYAMGYRVLMLAKSDKPIVDDKAPTNCTPIILITIEDHIREEAFDTIKWFKENGVQVKVISGDSAAAVAEIAAKVGIEGAGDYITLEGLSPQEVEQVASSYTVFGRVSPDQKAILIRSLKSKGNTVAMTGDGVNDILAMKEADCSIAMANGSEAARNVAHLVLLDSNFASMPKVVLEGRRVINNIQSSASLYLMKTIFVMVITLLSILLSKVFYDGYPFEPIQFFLLELLIIGFPSTILALQPNKEKIKGNFLANIILSCLSQAFCLIVTVLVIYLVSIKGVEGLNLTTKDSAIVNSICVMSLTYVGLVILFNICRPFNILRTIICLISATVITLAFSIPSIAETIGISKMFKDLSITHKLFMLVIILAIVPIARAFSDLINLNKNKTNAPIRG